MSSKSFSPDAKHKKKTWKSFQSYAWICNCKSYQNDMRENKSIILYCRWLFLIFVQISWTKSSMKSWVFINNLLHTSGLKSSVNCYCNCNVSSWISISLLTLLPKFLDCVKSFILDINWGYLPTLGNAQWREYHSFQPIHT